LLAPNLEPFAELLNWQPKDLNMSDKAFGMTFLSTEEKHHKGEYLSFCIFR